MRKTVIVLILLTLAISSLLSLPLCSAAPKPSIPQFTVKYIHNFHDVPAIATTDPYTGKNMIIQEGHRAENKMIEINIENQQYSYSYNGSAAWVAYNVRLKGHFEPNWTALYTPSDFSSNGGLCPQSPLGITNITLPGIYPVGGEVEFSGASIWCI